MSSAPTLFFLHIPKTAGTTLSNVFLQNIPEEAIFNAYSVSELQALERLTQDDMKRIQLIQGHIMVRNFGELFHPDNNFSVFTFLRSPTERVVSEYFFLRSWPKSQLYGFLNENDISLSEYVASDRKELRYRGANCMVNSLCNNVPMANDEKLEQAKKHLLQCALFGLTEFFDESLVLMQRQFGFSNIFYERQNTLSVQQKRTPTEEEVAVIAEHNALDTALYNFAKEEFAKRITELGDAFKSEVRMFRRINEKYQRVCSMIMERDGAASDDNLKS